MSAASGLSDRFRRGTNGIGGAKKASEANVPDELGRGNYTDNFVNFKQSKT